MEDFITKTNSKDTSLLRLMPKYKINYATVGKFYSYDDGGILDKYFHSTFKLINLLLLNPIS